MKTDFLIITQPRSGDEILISKLRSHPNIYIALGNPATEYSELPPDSHNAFESYLDFKFNVQNYKLKHKEQEVIFSLNTREHMQEHYDQYFEINHSTQEEKEKVMSFFNKVYSKSRDERNIGYTEATEFIISQYKRYGMTVFAEDLFNLHNNYRYQIVDQIINKEIKVIFLTRKNLLWRYASSKLKTQKNDQGYTKITSTTCNIDNTDLRYDIDRYEREQQRIIELLQQHNVSYISLTYEQLCDDSMTALLKVQQFLEVPVYPGELYGINTANIFEETRPLSVVIENYDQLKEQNKNTRFYEFFITAEKRTNPLYFKIREKGSEENLQFIKEVFRQEYLKMYKNTPVGDKLKEFLNS